MSNLVVLAFENMTDAGQMRDEHLIGLDHAAAVVRNQEGKVKVNHITSLTGAGALGGAFWGC